MSDGKVFQSVGAATEKGLAQYVFKKIIIIMRNHKKVLDDERS